MDETNSDAIVFFGAAGNLAYKQFFPALQGLIKRPHLEVWDPKSGEVREEYVAMRVETRWTDDTVCCGTTQAPCGEVKRGN